jgi:NTE family protein
MIPKKIDLALQGGGAHGAFTWGVIDRLLDDDRIEIEGVCGTSAGAMNGVCTVYGLKKGGRNMSKHILEKFWHKISEAGKLSPLQPSWLDKMMSPGNMDYSLTYKMFNLTTENFTPKQLNPLKFNPLEKILNEVINFEELHEFKPPKLFVCATNVKTCEPRIFGFKDITPKTILASACLPYMYDAVEIDGEYYWDGGYSGNPIIQPLIDHTKDADDILLIQLNPKNIDKLPNTVESIRDRVNELSFNTSLMHEIKLIEFKQRLINEGITLNGALKPCYLHNISADKDLNHLNLSSKLNTSWDFMMYLKDLGYKACENWLEQNFEHIGKKNTLCLN